MLQYRQRPVVPISSSILAFGFVLPLALLACQRNEPSSQTDSTTATSPVASQSKTLSRTAASTQQTPPTIPPLLDSAAVQAAVNPAGGKPYSGPTGRLRGVVRVSGDSAPTLDATVAKMKPECAPARAVYGKLFREGPAREVADVFVAVTGYHGFISAKGEAVNVVYHDCSYEQRTYGVTFGQRLEVTATGHETAIPTLIGAPTGAGLVAIPHGDPIRLTPDRPGRFGLTDMMRPYVFADVLVVKYPTFAVTRLDGRYDIGGLPPGEVTVNAFLPAAMITIEQKVTIKAGEPVDLDFTLPFDQKKYDADRQAAAPKASPSAH